MLVKIIEPKYPEELNQLYNLRYEILRKPWHQPLGSERGESEELSIHRMIISKETGNALAVGSLQFNSEEESQARYMAVAEDYQGHGLGTQILSSLEDVAREKGSQRMVIQARENAILFYKNNGYNIIEKTHLLFGEIQHWLMGKDLIND